MGLYETVGVAGFARLRGMYAFALWDGANDTGLLVRDRVGIKPMFFGTDAAGVLRFGSEAKAVLAQQAQTAKLSEGALHLLLNFRYVVAEQSLFDGIQQLAPGTILTWRRDRAFTLQPLPAELFSGLGSLADELADSVRAHLTADVEVGAYLSGGIDSAIVVALARSALGHSLQTFTLEVGDDPAEARNAATSAGLLEVDNAVAGLPAPSAHSLLRLLWHLETPKINALQSSALAGFTRRKVKVTLSGLGGDELFYGYNAHRWMYWASRLHPTAGFRVLGRSSAKILGALSALPNSDPQRAAQIMGSVGCWSRVYGLMRNVWDSPSMRRWLYGPRMLDAKLPDAFDWLDSAWPAGPDPLRAMADFEWRNKMVNDLLWHEDRASMAEGLEVRVPFADARLHAVVRELQAQTPSAAELGKSRLRSVARQWLPDSILNRPKSGFQLDATSFMGREMGAAIDYWLTDECVRRHAMFNPATVRQLRDLSPQRRSRWHSFMLWLMIQVHQWLELFEEGIPVSELAARSEQPGTGSNAANRLRPARAASVSQ